MVSTLNIVALFINVALCFLVPLTFVILTILSKQNCLRAILFGALTFCVSQMLIRIPLTNVVTGFFPSTQNIMSWQYIVFLVLMAAIFEEGGKYVGIMIGLKENKRWIDGVGFGVGFAGLYSMFFSGISYISNITASFYINKNGIENLIEIFGNDEMAAAKFSSALIDVKWYQILLNGMHDIFWIAIEVALSLLILYGIKQKSVKKSIVYLLLACASHLLMEGVVNVMGTVFNINDIAAEMYIALLGIISLAFIIWSKKSKLFEENYLNEKQKI